MIRIDKDSFVWLSITLEQAQRIFLTEAIEIYIVRPESESLAETIGDLQDAASIGFNLCLEVGHLPKEKIAKRGRKIYQATFNSELYTSMESARSAIVSHYHFDDASYKEEQKIIDSDGNTISIFPFKQRVITRTLK